MELVRPTFGALSPDAAVVGAASVTFANMTMLSGSLYMYVSNTDSWIQQGAAPVASAAAGSLFVPARAAVLLDGSNGAKLATIQDSAGGKASLALVRL